MTNLLPHLTRTNLCGGNSPTLQTDEEQATLAFLARMGPLDSDQIEPGTFLALEQLLNKGQIYAERRPAHQTFHHPNSLTGTGYFRDPQGNLLNGGYGYIGPNGKMLDEEGNPWTEGLP